MAQDQQRSGEAVRITTAAASHAEDIRKRQKRYLLSMSLRTLCFVGAVITAMAGLSYVWPFLIAGAIVLPYIAVVMANAAAQRTDDFELRDADYGRLQLESAKPTRTEL